MTNIYLEHLKNLRNFKKANSPAVSMYIPLRWTTFSPQKIFSALIKAADGLLVKEGHQTVNMSSPDWNLWMSQGTVTLSIFYNEGVTSFIPLQTRLQPRVVVAESFHVKPILIAAQEYMDGLLLHLNQKSADLYLVTQTGEALLSSYPYEKYLGNNSYSLKSKSSVEEFLDLLMQEIKGLKLGSTKLLGIADSVTLNSKSENFWKRTGIKTVLFVDSLSSQVPDNAFSIVRLRLSQMINEKHLSVVRELSHGVSHSVEDINVNNLAKKIMNKDIKNLCVSLEDMYFGELDPETGGVEINKYQKNTKDDDLLDDLLELAIDNGLKVNVVPKKYLPENKSILVS